MFFLIKYSIRKEVQIPFLHIYAYIYVCNKFLKQIFEVIATYFSDKSCCILICFGERSRICSCMDVFWCVTVKTCSHTHLSVIRSKVASECSPLWGMVQTCAWLGAVGTCTELQGMWFLHRHHRTYLSLYQEKLSPTSYSNFYQSLLTSGTCVHEQVCFRGDLLQAELVPSTADIPE